MLRLTLTRKLFLALATLLAVLLLTFAAFSILGLQRGLGAYVAEIELSRMDWLVQRLVRHHAAQGGWDRLRTEPSLWPRLLRGNDSVDGDGAVPADPRLPPWYSPGGDAPPGGRPDPRPLLYGPPPFGGGPDVFGGAPPPRMPEGMLLHRLAVFDAHDTQVAGARIDLEKAARVPLKLQGRRIGSLALAPIESLESEADRAFLARQRGLVAVAALGGLLLALGLSWWMARRWLTPIDELAHAAQRIARGQLQTRVAAQGSDELAALGRTFNHMAERLDRIEASRRAWLADVSHELRTPLAAMRAEIEALQDGVRSFDDRTALRLHRQIMRLGQLVDDLRSSMQEGDAAAHERASVYPLSVLREAVAAMQDRFAQAGLTLELLGMDAAPGTRPPPVLEGDSRRLHQAFMNLLENTLRYTHAGGRLRIEAHVEGSIGSAQRLVLDFDDSAPGVAPDELPRLFERLFRGESSRNRDSGGSGLGLSICRAIVEAHGGVIDAADSPLGGLRIRLTLPLK
ncbi:ATP-binding protein [Xenophilus arseniciresistens]|uniref:histidine kinase n=2 Tax=Xenophilus arseniciresistens TaxID=1283306 RepID=A0AAE3T295_9BURK|nr:ATP-binding protein [Xenophilus arseniciresistens]MDA7418821.1 ATP-binding protein [Xenophilus arseniciresistens]